MTTLPLPRTDEEKIAYLDELERAGILTHDQRNRCVVLLTGTQEQNEYVGT